MLPEALVPLTERLYEAAAEPSLWNEVLADLAHFVGAEGGAIVRRGADDMGWAVSPALKDMLERAVASGWLERDGFDERLVAAARSDFVGDLDLFAVHELGCEPVYRDFYYPLGLGWGAATLMRIPGVDDPFLMNLERRYDRGPVEGVLLRQLDALRPHLMRALLLSAKLQQHRARSALAALSLLGFAGAMISRSGRILAANEAFAALIPDVVLDHADRARFPDPAADLSLGLAMAQLRRQSIKAACSIPMPAREGGSPMVFHVMPLYGMSRDLFEAAAALLVGVEVRRREVPAAELLAGLFDLSPAESRVAHAIGGGATVEATAKMLGVSRETIRTQLKVVLAKTGSRRQADLVALIAGMPTPR